MSVFPFVRPSVVNTIASERKFVNLNFCTQAYIIHMLVLKMCYIGPQRPVSSI